MQDLSNCQLPRARSHQAVHCAAQPCLTSRYHTRPVSISSLAHRLIRASCRLSFADTNRECREKLEADRVKSQRELEDDRAWMRDFLAREAAQVQAEQALRDRQREELRLWLEALRKSSKAEELVRRVLTLVSISAARMFLSLCFAAARLSSRMTLRRRHRHHGTEF